MPPALYQFLRAFYMIYVGFANSFVNRIPLNCVRVFLYRNVYFMKIGKGTQIEMGVRVRRPRSISIGSNTNVHRGCYLDGLRSLKIGDNVDIGDEVSIYCGGHNVQSPEYLTITRPIVIEDFACIFARAMIIKGGLIAEGAVVAAASVVTKDVEPYTIVAGNPARKIGDRTRDLRYSLNPRFTNRSWQ